MQKPKNLLPGLFLCVFSRTAEPLVDFYCSNFWIFLFLFGADFFCRKERYCRPILYRLILRTDSTKTPPRPHERAPTQKPPGASSTPKRAFGNTPTKRPRARRAFTSTPLYLACRRAQKAPIQKSRKGAAPQRPPRKNPGSNSRGLVDESSFNLLLTHCGRFLAGCTGPACSRRPQ